MMASISHELRTPLNCSINMLLLAQEIAEANLNRDFIVPAYCSNILLLNLINDILDYS